VSGGELLKRVTLWVRNAERSLDLYRDAIGLSVLEDKQVEGPAIAAMLGLRQARLRIVHLGTPGSNHGWIGLYELSATEPTVPALAAAPEHGPAYGQATIVLTTNRMSEILPRVRNLGLRFMTEPRDYVKTTPGDATPPGRYREAIFFDPDGIAVSLIGYEPV
jgi:catechol 2,3-dioxygenase-like lactoylglutathione lyase family enzyme